MIDSVHIIDSFGKDLHTLTNVGQEALFGRDPNKCQIKFEPTAKGVSRVHASLSWTENGLIFRDKSTYGSTLNGKKVVNDKLAVGPQTSSLQIGESSFSIKVNEQETILEQTVAEEPATYDVDMEQDDDIQIVEESVSLQLPKNRLQRKRKPEAVVAVDEPDEPPSRGRRGPRSTRSTTMYRMFDEPEARAPQMKKPKNDDPDVIMEDETEELKKEEVEEEEEAEAESVASSSRKPPRIAAVSGRSRIGRGKEIKEEDEEVMRDRSMSPERAPLEEVEHSDRGPGGANETIKYTNLIFSPPHERKPNISIANNVLNFKRFKPKFGNSFGRNTTTSFFNNTTIRSNVSIQMIDSKLLIHTP